MAVPFFRTPYNYDIAEVSDETGLCCKDESKAVQSQAAETDINNIVKNFLRTGSLPVRGGVPLEGEIPPGFDFQTALDVVRKGERVFMEYPADIRARFGNDPARFVDFCTARDAGGKLVHLDELRSLGLAPAEAPQPAASGDAKP